MHLAAENAHQGRLSGAVLTEQSMDLTGVEVEINSTQRLNATERLADGCQLDEITH